jgi:hypothetical protein
LTSPVRGAYLHCRSAHCAPPPGGSTASQGGRRNGSTEPGPGA